MKWSPNHLVKLRFAAKSAATFVMASDVASTSKICKLDLYTIILVYYFVVFMSKIVGALNHILVVFVKREGLTGFEEICFHQLDKNYSCCYLLIHSIAMKSSKKDIHLDRCKMFSGIHSLLSNGDVHQNCKEWKCRVDYENFKKRRYHKKRSQEKTQ